MPRPKPEDFKGPSGLKDYLEATQAWLQTQEAIELDRQQSEEKKRKEEEARAKFLRSIPDAVARKVKACGVPDRAIANLSSLEETEARKAARGALDLLVLSGNPGCGKTVAAAEWVHRFIADESKWRMGQEWDPGTYFVGDEPVWVTAAKLARWERYDEDAMVKILKTPRLVIDDLGGEYLDKGGFYASLLDEIVNERQGGSCPTIMTTNLGSAAFKERYGERIVDRIREGGRFFECGNASLRRRPST